MPCCAASRILLSLTLTCAVGGGARSLAQSSQVAITVHAEQSGVKTSPVMYGAFFEEINHAGDGGLYAEMVRNRTFKERAAGQPTAWSLKNTAGGQADMALETANPLNPDNALSLRVTVKSLPAGGRVALVNAGYWGMALHQGEVYTLSFYARADTPQMLTVSLQSADGTVDARGAVGGVAGGWKRYAVSLTALRDDPTATLALSPERQGSLWLNIVSVFPARTYKARPNGLRPDLMQMLLALHPTFLRFPGGTYVQGKNSLANAFNWKNTLGDIAERPGHDNDAWGYWSTDGLGYHEYLQLCEDLGASPLFVVNIGTAAFGDSLPVDQTGPYIQDMLDAVEYANGPVSSKWGALRAKAGHPKPFSLNCLEIGNEDQGHDYTARFALFSKALRDKYPDIQIVSNGNSRPQDPTDYFDDHSYVTPEWLWLHLRAYKDRGRDGPKIYLGEFAAKDWDNGPSVGQGNLRAALAEAAFLAGLEQDGDEVQRESYAPLLANTHDRAWNPDLIRL